MFLVRYIEQTGTGSRDMIAECEKAGLPPPKWYVEDGDDFRIVIRRPDVADEERMDVPVSVPVNVPVNVPVTVLVGQGSSLTAQRVEQTIRENPGVNRKRLAVLFGVSEKTVGRLVNRLRGRIEFRGAPKTGGYYAV